ACARPSQAWRRACLGTPFPSQASQAPERPLVRGVLCGRPGARSGAPQVGRRSGMKWLRAAGATAVAAAVAIWACGGGTGSGNVGTGPDGGPPLVDGGIPDAGPPDAGPPDAGPPDAGPPDAGPPDAGPDPISFPNVPGW